MVKGYPDWRPPSAPGAFDTAFVSLVAAGDVIASPGAGKRVVLYGILISNRAGAQLQCTLSETTPANAIVRTLYQITLAADDWTSFYYEGVPFAESNKLRRTDANVARAEILATSRVEVV